MAAMTRQQAILVAEWFAARGFIAMVSVAPPDGASEPPQNPSYAVTGIGIVDNGPQAVTRLQALVTEAESRGLAAVIELKMLVKGT